MLHACLVLGLAVAGFAAGPTVNPPPDAPTLEAKTVSISWVGDMNFGTRGVYPPGGTAAIYEHVADHLRADLQMGNLETVLGTAPLTRCAPAAPPAKNLCYLFEAPPSSAQVLKDVGFGVVNLANNHSLDAGETGRAQTKAALSAAGVAWAGEPGQITYVTANGVRIGVIGFGPYPYSPDSRDIPAAKTLVQEAKANAQVVVVMMHMGAEGTSQEHLRPGHEIFAGYDRGDTVAFSHGVIDAGADLVVGSGPHVVRGLQWYQGHLIAYSLGDFSGYSTFSTAGDLGITAILHVTLDPAGGFVSGTVTPLVLQGPGIPAVDPGRRALSLMNSLSNADFRGTGGVIGSDGHIGPPPA